jgi:hypothetical protein
MKSMTVIGVLFLVIIVNLGCDCQYTTNLLTQQDKNELLQGFNLARSAVEPPASNMKPLVWDVTLESRALNYSQNCKIARDPNNKALRGEIFATSGPVISFSVSGVQLVPELREFRPTSLGAQSVDG